VRGEVRVQVAPGADVDRASQILTELALADERVLKQPAPSANVVAIHPGGVELALGFDVHHGQSYAVETQLRRQLLSRFADAGIALPSMVAPVRVVS
jgi:small-conductance mechanosensitive channel